MQTRLFRDAFATAGMNVKADRVPLDVRAMTVQRALEEIDWAPTPARRKVMVEGE